ncbi:sigma-70 family RNA polymerase sigma factor [Streptomyces sp. NBC_01216]|uniref:sigma-70 family RNA polymerase sigma factor n=1 Tax=unclassified Streptomyces TaxID=2593676 RepID=UPI002E10FC75|nr:sigma-70 family RNA polymerase sigma factor [Streptomyces sp. NBC_01216]
MYSDEHGTGLVEAAAAGDAHARERLVRAYLPLVYNIVGRALDGHADVDDLVQETMFRALDGLPGLRDPARFRSWLVAIAMNQIRRRWHDRRNSPQPGLDLAVEIADPEGDFVDLAILRLGLSGQRRELAEATRWLDETDRELLALWWLEAAGELTRAELAESLDLTVQHAAVRVQRMKGQLETGRAIVRALAARPPCPEMAGTTAGWDGRPAPLWRKRIARHLRTCAVCAPTSAGLAPAEGLLVGLGLVVPPALGQAGPVVPDAMAAAGRPAPVSPDHAAAGQPGSPQPAPDPGAVADPTAGSPFPGAGGGVSSAGRAWMAGAAALAVLGGVILLVPPERTERRSVPAPPTAAPPVLASAPAPPAPRPTAEPRPSRTATPTPTPTPTATPAPSAAERLTRLVNQRRAREGCAPLRTDARLTEASRAYARDMARRGYYGHTSPEGESADTRISDTGYVWSRWGENLARGTGDPAAVFTGWMDGAMHQENMLDCRYRDTGVAAVPGPDGTVWVQTVARPRS